MKQLETCNDAIFNLERAIPDGKQIMKAYEDNLTPFINIQSRLGDVKLVSRKTMKNEPTTKSLYTELRSYSEGPVPRISNLIDQQIAELNKDVRTLLDKVRELEMELSGWKSSKQLSEATIERLSSSRHGIEADLQAGKQAFWPILRVPFEVLATIFRYAIRDAYDSYLKGKTTNYGMRPPIFNISQVCQRWRSITQSSSEFW
jgi:hypothetical protein